MSTTPSTTHSRTSSTSSTRSSSPTYRLFPRPPKSSSSSSTHTRQISLQPHPYYQQAQPPQSTQPSSSYTPTQNRALKRRHTAPSSTPSHSHLTTSIDRATLPMLAHLNHQLHFARLEAERARVRAQIQRQETVLALSSLLKGWGGEEECSRWSDDEDDDDFEEGEQEC